MRTIIAGVLLFVVFLSPSARAQYIVIGESAASACYQHAISRVVTHGAFYDCDTALERDMLNRRDRAATFVNRGILQMYRGRSDAALADFDRAELLRPDFANALAINRSAALIRLDRSQESLIHSDLALQAGAEFLADAWFNRAVALESLGRIALAHDAYQEALAARPGWDAPERELRRFTLRPSS